MRSSVTTEEVLAAARLPGTTFAQIPSSPVQVTSAFALSKREKSQIIDRYFRFGFAIVQVGTDSSLLQALADSLSLGEPFMPPLYSTGSYVGPRITRISASSGAKPAHPSFQCAVQLDFHCDGTLQEIGYVKTSVLLCESPAASGGDTTLFNAFGAYAELASSDALAAAALATPGVLVRRATVNNCSDVNVGPAFTIRDGRLVCGYSVAKTDSWAVPDGVNAADLRRGVEALRRASKPGSPHFAQVGLSAGQVILLDNTRLSHGRTSYTDSESQQRCVYRGLYLRYPVAAFAEDEISGELGVTQAAVIPLGR